MAGRHWEMLFSKLELGVGSLMPEFGKYEVERNDLAQQDAFR